MPGAHQRKSKSDAKAVTRTCLQCGKAFPSEWCGNRVCKGCKASTNWQGGEPFAVRHHAPGTADRGAA